MCATEKSHTDSSDTNASTTAVSFNDHNNSSSSSGSAHHKSNDINNNWYIYVHLTGATRDSHAASASLSDLLSLVSWSDSVSHVSACFRGAGEVETTADLALDAVGGANCSRGCGNNPAFRIDEHA